jgi:hypothetical protein
MDLERSSYVYDKWLSDCAMQSMAIASEQQAAEPYTKGVCAKPMLHTVTKSS